MGSLYVYDKRPIMPVGAVTLIVHIPVSLDVKTAIILPFLVNP